MFSQNLEQEEDFCEAYKSQILNKDSSETESSFKTILKILTILLLLVIIIAISIYGYTYFIHQNSQENSQGMPPPTSIQISDDELIIQPEDPFEEKEVVREVITKVENNLPPQSIQKEEISLPEIKEEPIGIETPTITLEDVDIDQIANDVKLAISNELSELDQEEEEDRSLEVTERRETEVKVEKNLEIPTPSLEAQYLEELADLSRQIDRERR